MRRRHGESHAEKYQNCKLSQCSKLTITIAAEVFLREATQRRDSSFPEPAEAKDFLKISTSGRVSLGPRSQAALAAAQAAEEAQAEG